LDNTAKEFNSIKESMERVNILLIKSEEDDIANYVKRYGLNVKKTERGVRYEIYHKTSSRRIRQRDKVTVIYRLKLINGYVAYDKNKPESFIIGKMSIRGLEEGLEMMGEGEKAIIIVPSYLGYGVAGDDNKIPPRATLIYDIEVLKVENGS